MVTGEDVWAINANESVYYEYSRFNSNVTDLYADEPVPQPPTTTRRSSASTSGTRSRTRRATPSRSWPPTTSTAGSSTTPAAPRPVPPSLAGAVKQLRAAEPRHGVRRRR